MFREQGPRAGGMFSTAECQQGGEHLREVPISQYLVPGLQIFQKDSQLINKASSLLLSLCLQKANPLMGPGEHTLG